MTGELRCAPSSLLCPGSSHFCAVSELNLVLFDFLRVTNELKCCWLRCAGSHFCAISEINIVVFEFFYV